MATKVKSSLVEKLEALEKRSKKERAKEKSRLKRLKEMIRGYFFPADDIQRANHYGRSIQIDGKVLTAHEVHRIYMNTPCPCGHCEYYYVEVFDDGRYVVHHQINGVVKKGRL